MTSPVAFNDVNDIVVIKHVMLVDDHSLLAELLGHAMEEKGFRASVVAPSPERVMAEAMQWDFDIAILDVSFTDGNTEGIDLIKPLRELGMTVLMLTGFDDPMIHARCYREGAARVVTKSQPFDQLVDALHVASSARPVQASAETRRLIDELERWEAHRARLLAPFLTLTPREEQVLAGLVDGQNATELAQRAYVSLATVRAQVRSILSKLHAHSQLEAVAAAREANWSPRFGDDPSDN